MKIEVKTEGYELKVCTEEERKKIKEGMELFRQALGQDAIERRQRGPGLSKYWPRIRLSGYKN